MTARILIAATLLAAPATAQYVNVDVGGLAGAPSASYGAEARQPGFWNQVPANAAAVPLSDVDGMPVPGLTITIQGGTDFAFDHPSTAGDEAALFDDLSRATGSQTITLSNAIDDVIYAEQLVVYAWAPDDATALSTVQVVAPYTSAAEDVGGTWTALAGERWGRLYMWTPASGCDFSFPGDVVIQIDPGPGGTTTSVCGLQLYTELVCYGSFCSGFDGGLASCPCGNRGRPTAGCDTPSGDGGVRLRILGQEFAPQNRATLQGSGYPAAATPGAVVVRGSRLELAPFTLGDGILCSDTQGIVRLAGTVAAGGQSTHAFGHGTAPGSGVFYYQLWFRSQPAMYCTPEAFNTSDGVILLW